MDREKVLRTELDYLKTLFLTTSAGIVAFIIAFFANENSELDLYLFIIVLIAIIFSTFVGIRYQRKHFELVNYLKEK